MSIHELQSEATRHTIRAHYLVEQVTEWTFALACNEDTPAVVKELDGPEAFFRIAGHLVDPRVRRRRRGERFLPGGVVGDWVQYLHTGTQSFPKSRSWHRFPVRRNRSLDPALASHLREELALRRQSGDIRNDS